MFSLNTQLFQCLLMISLGAKALFYGVVASCYQHNNTIPQLHKTKSKHLANELYAVQLCVLLMFLFIFIDIKTVILSHQRIITRLLISATTMILSIYLF